MVSDKFKHTYELATEPTVLSLCLSVLHLTPLGLKPLLSLPLWHFSRGLFLSYRFVHLAVIEKEGYKFKGMSCE